MQKKETTTKKAKIKLLDLTPKKNPEGGGGFSYFKKPSFPFLHRGLFPRREMAHLTGIVRSRRRANSRLQIPRDPYSGDHQSLCSKFVFFSVPFRPGQRCSPRAPGTLRLPGESLACQLRGPYESTACARCHPANRVWLLDSKVLLTAVEFGLFTKLANRRLTGAELGDELELHPRGIADFFDALVAMRFLDRDGDGADAKYFNTPEGSTSMTPARATSAAFSMMLNARLFKFWHDLPEALRTGKPQNEIKHGQKGMFEELYADLPQARAIHGRDDRPLADQLRGVRGEVRFLALQDALRRRRRDRPALASRSRSGIRICSASASICRRSSRSRRSTSPPPGLSDRVDTARGDFFKDPLPKADVITMGMILHDWNLEKKMHLIRAAYDALPPGGAFIAIEALIDDARRENVFGLLMSLNMLIEFGDAFDYSGADFRRWCSEVGFKRFEVIHLAGPSSAAIAYK